MSGTMAFFYTMAPTLTANILTVTLVYCFAKIAQKEQRAEENGLGTYMGLIAMVFMFMLYGLYTWGFWAD